MASRFRPLKKPEDVEKAFEEAQHHAGWRVVLRVIARDDLMLHIGLSLQGYTEIALQRPDPKTKQSLFVLVNLGDFLGAQTAVNAMRLQPEFTRRGHPRFSFELEMPK